ncbi:MAG: hypothetical protein WC378_17455 [Opitutaceae bacterium]|jgi:hypothetical protein
MGIEIKVASPLSSFQNLGPKFKEPAMRRAMGRAIATTLRKHFTKLDSSKKNKLGGARTHFYGAARRGVHQPELYGNVVRVLVDSIGIAQRYYGGDISARPGSALTVPVHPVAYGHRAREFPDLQLIPSTRNPDVTAILARPNDASANGIMEVYYLLCKKVHQKEDKSVLPTDAELATSAHDAAVAYIKSVIMIGQN